MIKQADVHYNCICYQNGEKQTITLRTFERGAANRKMLTSHHILFVLSGAARYRVTAADEIIVKGGEFVFLPIGTSLQWEALESSTVLRFRLSHWAGELPECHTFRFQRTDDEMNQHWQGIYSLRMNSRIRHFVSGVVNTERDGLKCGNYARLMVAQLLTLIQVYYERAEYMKFYSTVASPDVVFTDQVLEKWHSCRSVGELANSFGLSAQQFIMHFRRVFGENPGAWLKRRRMEVIYSDVCSSVKTLREIADDNQLSMTNFIRYCRMNFGSTPGSIRESLSIKVPSVRHHKVAGFGA